MTRGCFDDAIACLKGFIEIEGGNPKTYALLGECFFLSKNYKEAEASFLQALNLNPGSDDVLISLGVICHMQGKKGDALSYFKKAGEINPVHSDLLANYSVIAKMP